ncbi:ABC transporter substrate-binding protein [Nonomuraea guangzhouensis]|uniref:ABC transporter substrate-binding protein n=1 Tax=Nonomuraea guangzhouensis TaxID=1291555 RepID=A0ABW4GBF9_9ACTN|nr:ABC transporter substrate-binding protein [Nonomuraea guangzhouensis]
MPKIIPCATTFLAAVVLLAGCGGGTGPVATDRSVVFVGTGGAYQAAQREAFVKPFAASSGIKVVEDQPVTYAKLKTMVDSGRVTWDVVEADPFYAIANCGAYVEKIDLTVVDVSKIDKELVSDCGVPDMKSAFLLVYNTEKFGQNPPASWRDFFDTKKFPGKRGMMNDAKEGGLEISLVADGVPTDKLYPIDYPRAFRKLDTIRNDLKFFTTGAEQQQAMETGQVDMVLAWPGRASQAVHNGAKIAPVWNQPMFFWDVLVVPKGTAQKAEAMKFIAHAITPAAQATLTEHIAYAPVHPDAKLPADEVTRQYLPLGQDKGTGFLRDMSWWAQNLDTATQKWTAWISR